MSKAVLVIDMPERCHDCPFLDGDDAWLNDPPKMVHRSTTNKYHLARLIILQF